MGRKGTVDIGTAGWNPREATQRELLALAIQDFDTRSEEIRSRVDVLCKQFPLYE